MPLYEYRCKSCHRRAIVLVRDFSKFSSVTCPNCGSADINRLFSTFSVRKSDMGVYEDILSDNQLVSRLEHGDPRALAEWNKKMSQGLDEEVTPEYKEMLDRMENGEVPGNLMAEEDTLEKS